MRFRCTRFRNSSSGDLRHHRLVDVHIVESDHDERRRLGELVRPGGAVERGHGTERGLCAGDGRPHHLAAHLVPALPAPACGRRLHVHGIVGRDRGLRVSAGVLAQARVSVRARCQRLMHRHRPELVCCRFQRVRPCIWSVVARRVDGADGDSGHIWHRPRSCPGSISPGGSFCSACDLHDPRCNRCALPGAARRANASQKFVLGRVRCQCRQVRTRICCVAVAGVARQRVHRFHCLRDLGVLVVLDTLHLSRLVQR
mmetsp:Transcript_61056/g.175161  ORF Transcript_61056/g.175161 Transcript_61056/m.175161 type:complete len:257 (-) Transcript_61056:567-1337(-)